MTVTHLTRSSGSPTTELGTGEVVTLFARLRWRLLRGAIRQGGAQRVAVTVGLVASVLVGVAGSVIVAVAARTIDEPRPGLVVFPVALVVAVVALGVIAGSESARRPACRRRRTVARPPARTGPADRVGIRASRYRNEPAGDRAVRGCRRRRRRRGAGPGGARRCSSRRCCSSRAPRSTCSVCSPIGSRGRVS